MSGDPVDKNQPRLPSWRPQPSEGATSSLKGSVSVAPVTDDIDDAWASGESPKSSERPRVTSRPPAVRVSSSPAVEPAKGTTRRGTLLGIAPAPETSSDAVSTPPSPPASVPPPSSPDSGASKFEAAARLLEQKRASQAPKPPPAESNSDAAPRSERGDAAPKSRRRSAPPQPRGIGIVPLALGAAVFVVMFLAGAMKALREEFKDAKPSAASTSSVVEAPPVGKPTASLAMLPAAPSTAAVLEPPTAGSEAPATAAAEPVASASAEPVATGDTTRVLVRSTVAGAKFYRNGKQVGMNSVIVDLAPGEKRAFEVNLAGHVSRKVVVDGSRSEVVVFLPTISEAPAAPGRSGPPPASTGEAASAGPQEDSTP